MGSIVRHIDDIIDEYGSWENYLEATKADRAPIMAKIDGLPANPDFLAWLHELTIAGYEENIMIPAEHADAIGYIYLTTDTIKEALTRYNKFVVRWLALKTTKQI